MSSCGFNVLGGPKTSQYLVCDQHFASRMAPHLLRIELIRLLIVVCGLLSTSLQWLYEVAGYWQETGTRVVYADLESIPNMLNGWHVRWVCWPCTGTGIFSASEEIVYRILATWGCALSSWQHEVMVGMNGTTMGLRISSWYICAFKMLSIKCTCVRCPITYAYPTAHHGPLEFHIIDIHTPLTHTTPYTLSASAPVQWKPGFLHEDEHFSKVSDALKCEHYSLRSIMTTNCSQVETLMRTTSMQISFPEMVSDSLCREIIWLFKLIVAAAVWVSGLRWSWRWSMLDVEVLGWCGYTWSAVWGRLDVLPNSFETPLETAYGREMNIKFTGNSSGGHSCSQHAIARFLKTCDIWWHCAVWLKMHILECTFIVASLRPHLCITMLSNQHLICHTCEGRDYIGKGEVPH